MIAFAPLFHDYAVLQRHISLPVWGTAKPGETVTVTLAGLTARTTASPEGRWLLRLPPLAAGGPHELTAESPSGRVTAHDILVGEVWICSGQSNMEFLLSQSGPLDKESAIAAFPEIRLLTLKTPARVGRQEEIDGKWQVCTPETLSAFSAVGGWFGRVLHQKLGVPVGLICNAWGGTRVQAWMSREALVQDPRGLDDVRHYESFVYSPDLQAADSFASFADWEQNGAPKDAGNSGLAEGWATLDFNDESWNSMPVPSRWQEHGHPGNGVYWFRRTLALPKEWMGRDLELHLGAVDKHDDTYVNGERVGGLSWEDGPNTWCTERVYPVPARLIPADGRLCIAVRARSHVYHGGLMGPGRQMHVFPAGDASAAPVNLTGVWKYAVEQDWGVVVPPDAVWGPGNPNSPAILFDSRLAPLIPFALRGALWYQGESNAMEPRDYRRLLTGMIRDWRRAWGQGDFPFLVVQLANYGPVSEPRQSNWAELREAQAQVLSEPNTGLAVTIDVGEAMDIHPKDKRTVGLRLAQWALAKTYGRGGLPSGPLYAEAAVEAASRMRIRFHYACGLKTIDGCPLRHVTIAGPNRTFLPAESAIEDGTLVVWHPEVKQPAAVRYAWADNPEGANLVNAEGLPAVPFRTDAW